MEPKRVALDVSSDSRIIVAHVVLVQPHLSIKDLSGGPYVVGNLERFPEDFMMQLIAAEWAVLRSQSVILKT